MNIRTLYWVGAAAFVSVSLGGVSQSKTASPPPQRSLSDAVGFACPALPNDAPPIAGLKTAWAMPYSSPAGIRLLFSDQVLACENPSPGPPPQPKGDCVPSWQFAFTLPPESQKPGVYDLHDYEPDYADAVVTAPASGGGCSKGPSCIGNGMGSAGGGKGPSSTVEIYSVTEECVTGRILRLDRGVNNSDVDFTGAFQAVICKPGSP